MEISINDVLYERVKKRMKTTGYIRVDDYIGYIISLYLSDENAITNDGLTDEEKLLVEKRLRELGYLE